MARTPSPAISTASGVVQPAPFTGFDTKPSTIAVENIGPMASAWATAAVVPSRRRPSSPPFAGGDAVSDMNALPFGVTEYGYIRRFAIKGQAPPRPLREALRRLSAEGFVEVSPYQGAIVSQLDL